MKSKNRILENPTTFAVILISLLCLIIGSFAVNFWITLIIIGLLDILYFRKNIIRGLRKLKKRISKEKRKKEIEKPVYEYKDGNNIVIVGEDNMKKKKKGKEKLEKQKKKIGIRILQWFLLFCCFCFLVGVAGVIAFCHYIVQHAPDFDPDLLYSTEPTTLYYSDGSLMATIGVENREIITYDELPEVFINALIATEDSNFFQHNGVDIKRFFVAAVQQVLGNSDAGGASTLTMQLSKNYYTSTTASGWEGIVRKFTDIYLSVFEIETTYTKEEILEFYVNSGQLGSRYGVEAASQLYFQKSAKDMNISEAALLAGMFQAPSAYNPYYHPEAAEKRRQTVLYLMHRHGYITDEEYEIALKLTVDKIVVPADEAETEADEMEDYIRSAVDTVVDAVQERTGENPRLVSMKIYTTIDKDLQKHVGQIMTGETYSWENDKVQAGIAVIDVNTGALVAVGGNRDNTKDGNLNHATSSQARRQIGSTAKPLYDYGPAIEYLNWSTGTIVADENITYSDGTSISNWDGKYNGFQTIRTELKLSRNIPALKTFQQVDTSKIYSFVTSLGLHPESPLHEAHAIGGYSGENALTMASAYAAFANSGYYTEPYVITKIVYTNTGETDIVQSTTKKVMSDATAYMITSMLQDAAAYGIDSGSYGNINGVKYAGKTGTTNFDSATIKAYKLPSKAVRDYWAVGYNTEYSIAVWYGYDNNTDGYNTLGSKQHTRLFQAVAKGIFTNKSDFTMPDSVVKVAIEKDSATLLLPSEYTPSSYIIEELFVAGTEPTTVSTRFSQLDDVSNLSATANGGTVTLSWTPIATPDAFNEEYLLNANRSAYSKESNLKTYVSSLLKTNASVLGTLGYNVYIQTDSGLTLLGWTQNSSYTVSGQSGNVTFVVKSCYSVFKTNMSSGKSITVNAGNATTVLPEETEEID